MLRLIRWASISLLGVVVLAWAVLWLGLHQPSGLAGRLVALFGANSPQAAGGVAGGLALGGPFTLVDTQGRTVTDRSFRGRWMLMYFGYTSCPDVCPTELQTVASALDRLGPAAARIAPVFITIDPARDTPTVLGHYTKLFDSRLIGLTGSAAEVDAAARAYRVYHAKVTPPPRESYLVNHSSFLYLMDPNGRFRALYPPGLSAEALATEIKRQMTTNS